MAKEFFIWAVAADEYANIIVAQNRKQIAKYLEQKEGIDYFKASKISKLKDAGLDDLDYWAIPKSIQKKPKFWSSGATYG